MPKHKSRLLKPPPEVYEQTVLDKSLFEKMITVSCVFSDKTVNSKNSVISVLKKYLFKMESFKPIQHSMDRMLIYLNPELISKWDDFAEDERKLLQEEGELSEANFEMKILKMTYENYTAQAILKAILPKGKEGVSSFTKIGHIVHVNLREHLLPYKAVIGEVLFDKTPCCRTVVNKMDMIDNTFRFFQMELLKGDDDMLTQVKENRCTFEFDFSKVYWNSRLSTEHERIVNLVKNGDVLFDVFAGVGPFSLPIAKKKCFVYANDLNPESFNWLNHNAKMNKIDQNYLMTFNLDGKEFILKEIKNNLLKYINEKKVYITMNLPAKAIEFISLFIGLFTEEELEEVSIPPVVFLYCFAKGENPEEIVKGLLSEHLRCELGERLIEISKVRTVSSLKEMMRVSFKLDRDFLTGTILKHNKRKVEASEENATKKCNHGEKQTEED